ncbi:MAG TPA: ribbon-helix-helix protein, CopG family [Candidatus Korarchaeota archaeon]|nr:MAG: hypothetical protein DRJ43_06070 [Thermoprotei archaeon]HDD69430.1 ribbon-helix-helix protein, CopG family [Candidatus Korarchaeota archaeon]
MSSKVVIQVRLPAKLVRELDKLTEEGYYSNRTEAIADAIRHLLERYGRGGKTARVVRMYLLGRRPSSPGKLEVDVESARQYLIEQFGTDELDVIVARMRRRLP